MDPDVAEKLKRRMAQKKVSLKAVVNEALRAGLKETANCARPKFKVEPHSSGGFLPGIDPDKLNQLLDQLDIEEFARKMALEKSDRS